MLRTILIASLAAAISLFTPPAGANPTVTVTITGIRAEQGAVMVALYDEARWSGPPVATAAAPARGASVVVTLAAPSAARYGVKLFHDVDGDGALDANAMGIPTEPYGFSNNARGMFGPPDFAAAAFAVGADGARQTIALQ